MSVLNLTPVYVCYHTSDRSRLGDRINSTNVVANIYLGLLRLICVYFSVGTNIKLGNWVCCSPVNKG